MRNFCAETEHRKVTHGWSRGRQTPDIVPRPMNSVYGRAEMLHPDSIRPKLNDFRLQLPDLLNLGKCKLADPLITRSTLLITGDQG